MDEPKSYEYRGYTIIKTYYGWRVYFEGGRFVEFETPQQAEGYIDSIKERDV